MTQHDAQKFLEQAKRRRAAMVALAIDCVRRGAKAVSLGCDPPPNFRPSCFACPSEELMTPTTYGWRCDHCGSEVDRNLAPLNA